MRHTSSLSNTVLKISTNVVLPLPLPPKTPIKEGCCCISIGFNRAQKYDSLGFYLAPVRISYLSILGVPAAKLPSGYSQLADARPFVRQGMPCLYAGLRRKRRPATIPHAARVGSSEWRINVRRASSSVKQIFRSGSSNDSKS